MKGHRWAGLLGLVLLGSASAQTVLSITAPAGTVAKYLIQDRNSFTVKHVTVNLKSGVTLSPADLDELQRDLTNRYKARFTRDRFANGVVTNLMQVKVDTPAGGPPRLQIDGFLPGAERSGRVRQSFLPDGQVRIENIGAVSPTLDRTFAALSAVDLRVGLPDLFNRPLVPGQSTVSGADLEYGAGTSVKYTGVDVLALQTFSFDGPLPLPDFVRTQSSEGVTQQVERSGGWRSGTVAFSKDGMLGNLKDTQTADLSFLEDTERYQAQVLIRFQTVRTIDRR